VWEEYLGPRIRTALSLFRYDAEQLIEQRSVGGNSAAVGEDDLYFANAGRTKAHGVECVDPFLLTNLFGSTTINKTLEFGLGLYNLFDRRYADPGAEEHLQPAIGQDGRTFRVRLTARF
jgi:outer membrane receptor protein involved in Fe transport